MFQKGTIFFGKGENGWLNLARLPFMPLIGVPLFFLIRHIIVHGHVFSVLGYLSIAIGIAAMLAAFVYALDKYFQYKAAQDPWYMDDNEINLIVCSGQQKPYTLAQLPRHHRTLRLRFKALKSQVCRPFSK